MSRAWVQADIVSQSFRAVVRRPLRSILTAIGVALGVAVFVATLGLASTLDAEVNETFDSLRATRLVVQDAREFSDDSLFDVETVDELVGSIDGVAAGGLLHSLGQASAQFSHWAPQVTVDLATATPGGLEATLATVSQGRMFDDAMAQSSDLPVAVVGSEAAERLGISTLLPGMVVMIGDVQVLVAGILGTYGSEPQLGTSVTVELHGLERLGMALPSSLTALVRTDPGAAQAVAQSLPLVLRPHDPTPVGISMPPEPQSLREGVQGSLDALALGVAGLSILIGGIGIMNAMTMAVSQRTGEIALRRALGARRGHIVEHVLTEGILIGLLGAVVGLITGVVGLLVVSYSNGWQPVLAAWVWLAPPAAGLIVGSLAGIYPAVRAARLSPATGLRS